MSKIHPGPWSAGPDAVHLCLTVGEKPHLFGCAWASYGEPCVRLTSSAGSRDPRQRVVRARRLVAGPPGGGSGGAR